MAARPLQHTIIEAHPDVLRHAEAEGWAARRGVRLLAARWQEAVATEMAAGRQYDAVFFDTYMESYGELRRFLSHLPRLLKPGGCCSFFNGAAADNLFFHAVYCRLAQLDVAALSPLPSSSEQPWSPPAGDGPVGPAGAGRYELSFEAVQVRSLGEDRVDRMVGACWYVAVVLAV